MRVSVCMWEREKKAERDSTRRIFFSDASPGEGKGYLLQYSGLEDTMGCIVHGVGRESDTTERLSYYSHTHKHTHTHWTKVSKNKYKYVKMWFWIIFNTNLVLSTRLNILKLMQKKKWCYVRLVGFLILIVFLQNQAAVQFHHHYINYIDNVCSLVPKCQLVILAHCYNKNVFFLVNTNIKVDFTILLNIWKCWEDQKKYIRK